MLEDLAAHFKMKAQDTIDRVTQLLEQGHITGVMDDRGKFIYISQVGNHIRCQLDTLLLIYIYYNEGENMNSSPFQLYFRTS